MASYVICAISIKSTTYNDKTNKVGITLPKSLIKETDKLRGDIRRSTYIRRAVEYYLRQIKVRRPLRESRHHVTSRRRSHPEAHAVRAGSHNETTSPTYSLSPAPMVI
jgi:metal-responsive CopG/Arc/MetJ family transcriptional regulator